MDSIQSTKEGIAESIQNVSLPFLSPLFRPGIVPTVLGLTNRAPYAVVQAATHLATWLSCCSNLPSTWLTTGQEPFTFRPVQEGWL